MPFAAAELKKVFGQFATGVVVVTAYVDGTTPIGLTVNSFNSVSLNPPLILFSVSRKAPSLGALLRAPRFGISVLAETQEEVSRRFAGEVPDKWSGTSYSTQCNDIPFIPSALARFQCAHYAVHEGGDHLILVGEVLDICFDAEEGPLVFFRGKYRRLSGDVLNGPNIVEKNLAM